MALVLVKGCSSRWVRLLFGLAALAMVSSALAKKDDREPAVPAKSTGGISLSFSVNLPLESPEHEPDELLILWHTAEEARVGRRWMQKRYGLAPVQVDQLNALGLIMGQFKLGRSPSAQEIKKQLRQTHPRWVVDLNTRNSLLADSSTAAAAPVPRLFALKQLGLSPTDDASPTPMRLGVADTAFELWTPLRVSRLVVHDVLGVNDVPASTEHGTAIARLIAGAPLTNGFSGVAQGVELFWARTVRIADGQPRSNTAIMTRAVNWLAEQGVTVINISQGGPGDDVLKEVFARLVERPVLVVAAAGNSGPSAGPVFPAAYPGVLAVTAIDADANAYALANRGGYISLSAPGVDVWVPSTALDQNSGPMRGGQYLSGTSFASALVAGSLAYADRNLWQASNGARIARLCGSARDLGEPGRDPVFGCGLLRLPRTEGQPSPAVDRSSDRLRGLATQTPRLR